jgi:hypothetical protein
MLMILLVLLLQAGSPFDLPIVAALGAAISLPTKIAVDVIKGAVPRLPGGVLPLIGVLLAFGIALLFQVATSTPFNGALFAQCGLAALIGQGGAMVATATQANADMKRALAAMPSSSEPLQGKSVL